MSRKHILLVAALGVFLAGCGATVTSTSDSAPPPPTANSASATPEAPSGESDAPEETPTPNSGTVPFGGTATLSTGVGVSISEPKAFKASKYAAGVIKGGSDMEFTVTIVNDGAENYDPGIFSMSLAGGPNGEACSAIFDTENGFNGAPTTTVLPGKRTTFKYAMSCPPGVKSGDELVADVLVDFIGEDPIFVGIAP